MRKNKMKLIGYLGIIALLASMIVALLGFSNSRENINNIKNQLLKNQVENNINLTMKYIKRSYGTLSQGKETLLDSDGNSIEGESVVVDSILEDLGNESTIFVKVKDDFKRISTNVMSNENERIIGSFLGTDHKAYQTVMDGGLYIGEAEILGESYYTAYQPVKDINDNVIGLLFVGTPTKKIDEIIEIHDDEMSRIDILVIVLRTISLGSLIALLTLSVAERSSDDDADHSKI